MYLVAFGYVTHSSSTLLALTGIFVVLSQLKINVTNAYAGSIAWSNFFLRLTHRHPGRVVWLFFNVGIALLLMELGVYRVFEDILGIYAVAATSWLGSVVADLTLNKWLKLRPAEIEFRRAYLCDINPCRHRFDDARHALRSLSLDGMAWSSSTGFCLNVIVVSDVYHRPLHRLADSRTLLFFPDAGAGHGNGMLCLR
ncbi:hypothetical protein LNP25_00165 [Klebsiella variicola subsp. variicola]|nr:hypothetical protein [Klebsiella variicola subsp. variicola]